MRPNSIYKMHPAIAYGQTVVDNLLRTHDKTLEEFRTIVAGQEGKARAEILKKEFGMGSTQSGNLLSALDGELNGETYDPDGDVDRMFGDNRAWMRPIYDELLAFTLTLGPDVWVSPCQKFVPFYRGQKFAEIHSETNTRMSLYVLVDQEFQGFGPVPPRVDKYNLCREFTTLSDLDDSTRAALKHAYDLKAGAKFPWGNAHLESAK